MDLPETIEAFKRFRVHVERGAELPHLRTVKYFGTYFREPHYCDAYRDLHQRELELNAGVDYAVDYELLSVWRLAKDPSYAPWARSIGVRKCQISLFGLQATNDWFYRRSGAHRDILVATDRLIENGIQPRWQIFLNRKGLPELSGILELIRALRLEERVADQGSRFERFLNDPTPIGEALNLLELRLVEGDAGQIPAELVRATEQYLRVPFRPRTEAQVVADFLAADDAPIGLDYPHKLWLWVTPDWGVYPSIGTLEPWWRLGNLKMDGLSEILSRFREDRALGLRAAVDLRLHEAARLFGDDHGDRLYLSASDLRQLWLERSCEQRYKAGAL